MEIKTQLPQQSWSTRPVPLGWIMDLVTPNKFKNGFWEEESDQIQTTRDFRPKLIYPGIGNFGNSGNCGILTRN